MKHSRHLAAACAAALAACTLAPTQAPAQHQPVAAPPVRLTLEEAGQRALSLNKELALARLNLDAKRFATAASRRDYFPKLLGNVTYFRFNEDLGRVVTAGGARGLLAPGTPLIEANVINQDAALSTVTVAQPITKLIAIHALVQINRAEEHAAAAKLDKGTRDLLSGVAQLYHGLLGAQKLAGAAQMMAGLAEQQAKAAGTPEVRVALLEARQGLLEAQTQAAELADRLCGLLDLPPGTRLELVEPPLPGAPVASEDEAAHMAAAASPEVLEASQDIAKAEAALKIARSDYLPDVAVFGTWFDQTAADYIQDNFAAVGVTASYTFVDWGKRRLVKRQRQAQIALAHQNVRVVADRVEAEARKAYRGFEKARQAVALAGDMVAARREIEALAKDPAARQAAFVARQKAELANVQAELGYRVAHAQLVAVLGPAHRPR